MKEVDIFQEKSPQLELIFDAIVCPLTNFDSDNRAFDGGVFYANRNYCSLSKQTKAGYDNTPSTPDSLNSITCLQGIYVYGGMLQNRHFGHFLIESLSRLWIVNKLKDVDAIVFYLRSPNRPLAGFIINVFDLLFPGINIEIITDITKIETLFVPEQLCMKQQGYILGHPAFRDVFSFEKKFKKSVFKKIYVSRSKLKRDEGIIVCEDYIEKSLENEGYSIIHPQDLSIEEQVSIYSSAQEIVFSDGSAFHLYVLFANSDQKVFIIWRREKHAIFDFQLSSFSSNITMGNPALKGFYKPKNEKHVSSRHKAILDFENVYSQLTDCGFILGLELVIPTHFEIEARIQRISKKNGKEYEYYPI